jgi:hypothetical protein
LQGLLPGALTSRFLGNIQVIHRPYSSHTQMILLQMDKTTT